MWTSQAITWMGSAMTTLQNHQSHYLDRSEQPELRASVVSFLADAQGSLCRDIEGCWECRYHNLFCHWHRDAFGYSDRYRHQRVDEQSTICRLSDAHHTLAGWADF